MNQGGVKSCYISLKASDNIILIFQMEKKVKLITVDIKREIENPSESNAGSVVSPDMIEVGSLILIFCFSSAV